MRLSLVNAQSDRRRPGVLGGVMGLVEAAVKQFWTSFAAQLFCRLGVAPKLEFGRLLLMTQQAVVILNKRMYNVVKECKASESTSCI